MNRWFAAADASSELVPIERFVDDHFFATRSGAFGPSFEVTGVDPEALSDAQLDSMSRRLVQALRLIPEDCSLYQILVKRSTCELPTGAYVDSANAVTQQRRLSHLKSRQLVTVELYWTICIHPRKLTKRNTPKIQRAENAQLLRRLRNIVTTVQENLSDLIGLRQLDHHAIGYLYGYLANLEPVLVRQKLSSAARVDRQLARSAVRWHNDGLEVGRQSVRLFSLIQRPGATRPNLFGDLLRLPADLVLVLEMRRAAPEETRKAVSSASRISSGIRSYRCWLI